MICVLVLVVSAVASLFSIKYRMLTKEAFRCVTRRMMLKPCETDLETRVKSQITGRLMGVNPKLAKFVYNYFEAISWVITISLVVVSVYAVFTIYSILFSCGCQG